MEILFLGTAAAEGWPAVFCSCHACSEARRLGGKDFRTRAGALIDNIVKIDFGPDVVCQMQRTGRDLTKVSTLLFTHEHDDHCIPAELAYRKRGFITADTVLPEIEVYGNGYVMDALRRHIPDPASIEGQYFPLAACQPVTTADGTSVFPVPAAHTAGALLLRIERGGKRLLWGHDTGIVDDETIDALAGVPLDIAVFDCTYGATSVAQHHHMGIEGIVATAERLRKVGAITDATKLVATHFSHNSGLLHEQLVERFKPYGVTPAYDGMVLEV